MDRCSPRVRRRTRPSGQTLLPGQQDIHDCERRAAWGGARSHPRNKDDLHISYAALIQVPADAPDNAGAPGSLPRSGEASRSNGGNAFAVSGCSRTRTSAATRHGSTSPARTPTATCSSSATSPTVAARRTSQVSRWIGNDTTGSLGSAPVVDGRVCGGGSPTTSVRDREQRHDHIRSVALVADMAANTFVEAGIDLTTLLGRPGRLLQHLPGGQPVVRSRPAPSRRTTPAARSTPA